ncbi:MAG: tetratricopeptide repeat protein [FCB group bacterium]|nr:tetratricopeptide repeat protein [FCB group bacterium]
MKKKNKSAKKSPEMRKSGKDKHLPMRSSILGWMILAGPVSIILFFLIFSSKIPFVVEQSAKEAEDTAEKVWRFGQQFLREGNYQNAYGSFMKALEIDPDLAEAYIGISQLLYQNNQIDQAIQSLNKALSLNPPQKDLVMNNLGLLYAQKQDFNTALGIFKQVLELGVRLEQAYNNTGNVYLSAGNYTYAAEAYRLSLENKSDIASLYHEMLYITVSEYKDDPEVKDAYEAAKQQFEEGVTAEQLAVYDCETADKYARTKPREVELMAKYAMALERSGNHLKAEEVYLEALKIIPRNADICCRLGELYARRNEIGEAQSYYLQALKIDRTHKKAAEGLGRLQEMESENSR